VDKFYAYCKKCNTLIDHFDYYCLTCKTLFDKEAAFKWIKEQKVKEKGPKPKVKATPKTMTTIKPKTKSIAKAKPVTKAKSKAKPKKKAGSTLKTLTKSTVGAAKRVNNTRKKVENVASKIWGY
jgi:hypothetical protein